MKKLLILLIAAIVLGGCSTQNSSNSYYNSSNESKKSAENPYNSGSGHSAGYEWAQRTGGGCSGNSNSFNEGCEEYYRQLNE